MTYSRLTPGPTIGKNRHLVTDEPVEFEKWPVEVHQDCSKITDHFRGIHRILCPNFIKENWPKDMSTCNQLDLQTLGSQPTIMPKNLPDQCSRLNLISSLWIIKKKLWWTCLQLLTVWTLLAWNSLLNLDLWNATSHDRSSSWVGASGADVWSL